MFSRLLIQIFMVQYKLFLPDNRENTQFTGKVREKLFFWFSVNSISIKLFEIADSVFHGFRINLLLVHRFSQKIRIYREIPVEIFFFISVNFNYY